MQDVTRLAESVAERLAAVEGVEAVALSGAWTQPEPNLESEIELSIYFYSDAAPSVTELRTLALSLGGDAAARSFGDEEDADLPAAGVRLWIEGRRVDWQFRDVDVVREEIDRARSGIVAGAYQPGNPHGFFGHSYMAVVHYSKPLVDPDGLLARMKGRTAPFPKRLKYALLTVFSREADVVLYAARMAAGRGDLFYAYGCLFRCAACLLQVVYAANDQYLGSLQNVLPASAGLANKPVGFEETLARVLGSSGTDSSALMDAVQELEALVSEVRRTLVTPNVQED